MSDRLLPDSVAGMIQFALDRTAGQGELAAVHDQVARLRQRLLQPMRVAIVGRIKVGKSTFLNALLGQALAPTGAVEATFNVNWMQYASSPSVVVHYKNGRPPDSRSIAELEAVTRRATENMEYLLSIRHVVVYHPSPILNTFHLIDTPGIASFYEHDSQNTRDFIQAHGEELTLVTRAEAGAADALLYLLARGVAATDEALIKEFQGPVIGQATPINAIGLLNKVELYWPAAADPMDAGRRIATRLAEHPQVRSLLYGVYPICGLLAFGARTLTEDELDVLHRLARLPEGKLKRLMGSASRFVAAGDPDLDASPAERQQLLDRLGHFGTWLACRILRDGAGSRSELAQALLDYSGLPVVENIITAHFGNRASLVKLAGGVQRLLALCFQERQRLAGQDRQAVVDVAGRVEALARQDLALQELDVLRSFYEGRLDLSNEEAAQLLQVTGEYGTSVLARLGLDGSAPVESLLPRAEERLRYWRLRASDVMGSRGATVAGAHVLARSHERLVREVSEAVARLVREENR